MAVPNRMLWTLWLELYLQKRGGQGVCERVLQHTKEFLPKWTELVQNVTCFGSRGAEADGQVRHDVENDGLLF